jgi:DnaJ-class molecular chaperone
LAQRPPVEEQPAPCQKCGGTGEVDTPERFRSMFGDHKFVCDRCGGTKIEQQRR